MTTSMLMAFSSLTDLQLSVLTVMWYVINWTIIELCTISKIWHTNKDILWCFCIDFNQNDCSNWSTTKNISIRWLIAGLFSHIHLKFFLALERDSGRNKAVKYWKLTVNLKIFLRCSMHPAYSIDRIFHVMLNKLSTICYKISKAHYEWLCTRHCIVS